MVMPWTVSDLVIAALEAMLWVSTAAIERKTTSSCVQDYDAVLSDGGPAAPWCHAAQSKGQVLQALKKPDVIAIATNVAYDVTYF